MEKLKAVRHLGLMKLRSTAWELWLFVALIVTVFGLAAGSFTHASQNLSKDPYGVRAEPGNNDSHRNHVETGL
jgi:hypothetical protein